MALQVMNFMTSVLLIPSALSWEIYVIPYEKKVGVVKTQEKKERWKEKKVAKRQKKDDKEEVVVEEEEENVQPVEDPLEKGFLHHAQREAERMTERLLKRTYSKKNKMVSPPP
ncbi:Dynein heavy chain-like protein MAL7P1.162 [Dissostichus eleginoides]|uniref:Dynein heavy chain-like protein MAL7P1.162 n=1 Tax=Dissostichus eleginoides TaxID=100907 RepID=A0AAD9C1Z4_DISEL|nr:Dynein heavy chain-like protein MAL7P1.162 [Dissostichus eleginoides]